MLRQAAVGGAVRNPASPPRPGRDEFVFQRHDMDVSLSRLTSRDHSLVAREGGRQLNSPPVSMGLGQIWQQQAKLLDSHIECSVPFFR
jgi:hypothetical protein